MKSNKKVRVMCQLSQWKCVKCDDTVGEMMEEGSSSS